MANPKRRRSVSKPMRSNSQTAGRLDIRKTRRHRQFQPMTPAPSRLFPLLPPRGHLRVRDRYPEQNVGNPGGWTTDWRENRPAVGARVSPGGIRGSWSRKNKTHAGAGDFQLLRSHGTWFIVCKMIKSHPWTLFVMSQVSKPRRHRRTESRLWRNVCKCCSGVHCCYALKVD